MRLAQPPEYDPQYEPPYEPQTRRWPPAVAADLSNLLPGWGTMIWRGVCGSCPRCGQSKIFAGYLKVEPQCAVCGARLGEMPADDAPPYIAMILVLHVMTTFVVLMFRFNLQPGIAGAILLLVLLTGLCCIALRLAKGAVIGILLKLGLQRDALNV